MNKVVIFVEGETDKVFFTHLLQYYRRHSTTPVNACDIYNLKGFGKYESKAVSKVKNDVKPKLKKGYTLYAICCSYDTDVFEFAEHPPVDFRKVGKEILAMGIPHFVEVKAKKMIEDWFLKDLHGLCSFLKIKPPQSLKGKDGFNKMKLLFKSGNKIYQKGSYSHKFLESMDIAQIRGAVKPELRDLERVLNVTI